ncbi:MAG: hypothetical protein A3I12_05425 [Gammaproteobacteria bacterium RIFCSPLOWO2_02_FULL_38_11]|nr:MAG: hypothetical protein A3B69_04320 [Gammaproteobacteria bacterium RIFCSPHIGHO2_02_FULL_38_33]OGT24398.1 MAG: hypothetical protein A2W47_03560 [Gammaproteobacteria bacterium RIFCSPHIGHO2_12_38_15]OGT67989.1 MAG: hypothetical protein A3I12_05425 [Gammaproteobacteria bacterium RIFCSPLOWO2_02_FULL_38_11]OGT76626.1 MAG: hypothetical protein A3G71_02460 [Gammaproteobacteria bacterium RIFCSPLOWO2_12_FULL_38_14]
MQLKGFILTALYTLRQAIFAGIVLLILLAFFNKFSYHPIFNAIGLSSIASSIFIIFTAPHTLAGQNKAIVGGYVIAISLGIGFHFLLTHHFPSPSSFYYAYYPVILGGLTLTLTLLLMVTLRMPHPPAAGFALGLILDNWEFQTLLIVACIIAVLVLLKNILDFKPLIS